MSHDMFEYLKFSTYPKQAIFGEGVNEGEGGTKPPDYVENHFILSQPSNMHQSAFDKSKSFKSVRGGGGGGEL